MDRLYEGCKVKIDPSYAAVFKLPVDGEGTIVDRLAVLGGRWVVQFDSRRVCLHDNRIIALSPARKEQTVDIADLIAAIPYVAPALSIPDPE